MRYHFLDEIRGITLLSMILYHGIWDLVYVFNVSMPWYEGQGAYLWQQSICCTFIFLSGFCWSFGKTPLKRGLVVSLCGALITIVTLFLPAEEHILFGVLTLLGASMLLMAVLDRLFRKVPAAAGVLISTFLFLFTKNVNMGELGIGSWRAAVVPNSWKHGLFMTFLGFTEDTFYSADYFSLFPWVFLFFAGYFAFRCSSRTILPKLPKREHAKIGWLAAIGRHSLEIYMLHQPIVYGILWVIFAFGIIPVH